MHDHVGDDAPHHHADSSHEHDEHALAHNPDDGRDIDLYQHEHDENRERELAETRVDDRGAGDYRVPADRQVAQEYRRCVDEEERRDVIEKPGLCHLGEQEEKRRDATKHCKYADRRRDQDVFHAICPRPQTVAPEYKA